MRIFSVCPANVVTGGPELLHQLTGLLQSRGADAFMLYTPLDEQHSVPEPYEQYEVRVGRLADVTPDSIIIVPESYDFLLATLPPCRIFYWWLSVDNFRARFRFSRKRFFFPWQWREAATLRRIARMAELQLYQSEYARDFVAERGIEPSRPLSDYLSPQYIAAAQAPDRGQRDNLLVYNPAKGAARTKRILDHLRRTAPFSIEAVPVEAMTREQVIGTLRRAKLYIDFGEHPGKDRLPREAAALGCCILVNRRGSAANNRDLAIADEYKIDDSRQGFEHLAAEKIVEICGNYSEHRPQFDTYRRKIVAEPDVFVREAEAVFGEWLRARESEPSSVNDAGA